MVLGTAVSEAPVGYYGITTNSQLALSVWLSTSDIKSLGTLGVVKADRLFSAYTLLFASNVQY